MRTETSPTGPGLYQRLLGERWLELDEAVRRMHDNCLPRRARGLFRVTRRKGALTNLLARLSRLPSAQESVAARLTVTGDGEAEKWARGFGSETLVTVQREA